MAWKLAQPVRTRKRKPGGKPVPGRPKLTAEEVLLMREMHKVGYWEGYRVTHRLLSEWFYITPAAVGHIIERRTWKRI